MELWVRSQNKRYLQKIKSLCLDDNDNEERVIIYGNISDEDFELGSYATIERALEVLDEIQNILKPIIYYEPITRERIDYTKPYVQMEQIGSKSIIEELSTYVYEMPKE